MKLNNLDYNLKLELFEYTRFKYENSDKHPPFRRSQIILGPGCNLPALLPSQV